MRRSAARVALQKQDLCDERAASHRDHSSADPIGADATWICPLPEPSQRAVLPSEREFSLYAFKFVFTDPTFYRALRTSILVAIGMTPISIVIGTAFAFLIVRTDLPGRRWIEPLILFPMFISSVILAFGYVVALGPVGIVSLMVRDYSASFPGTSTQFADVADHHRGLTHVPHVFIYAASASARRCSEIEEAARTAGAGPLRVALQSACRW